MTTPAWPQHGAPPRRKSGKHLVGYPATALLALLFGVAVGAAGAEEEPVGGTGVTTAAESSTEPTAKPGASKPAKPGAKGGTKKGSGIGKPYRDGKFQFTVTKVRSGVRQVGNDTLGAKAQGQFVLVSMTVENIGTEPQSLFGDNQKLFDGAGRQYSADTEAAIYLEGSNSLWEEINPGNKVKGIVVFDVPRGVKPAKLELHDALFSGGVEVPLR